MPAATCWSAWWSWSTEHFDTPGRIAIPINQPSVVERLADERGFEVLRTRVDRSSLMGAAREKGVVFAGAGDGGFMFPEFMPAYDAMMAFARLLEMLASPRERACRAWWPGCRRTT